MANFTISQASDSERDFLPKGEMCDGMLLCADAGFIDKTYFPHVIENKGYFIHKGKTNCSYKILEAQRYKSKRNKYILEKSIFLTVIVLNLINSLAIIHMIF